MHHIQVKSSAVITSRHFDPCMIPIWQAILEKWPKTDGGIVCITEGWRVGTGLHPHCRALDVRTNNIALWPTNATDRKVKMLTLCGVLRNRLGKNYDVVSHMELVGTDQEHIHIEFDERI